MLALANNGVFDLGSTKKAGNSFDLPRHREYKFISSSPNSWPRSDPALLRVSG
jgi:hypothetical protein